MLTIINIFLISNLIGLLFWNRKPSKTLNFTLDALLLGLLPPRYNRLDFETCQQPGCKYLVFKDTTGAYDVNTNTGGWGAPNPTLPDYTATTTTYALVLLYDPDLPLTYDNLLDPISYVDITSSGFPTTDVTKELTLSATQFGYEDGVFPDGRYTLGYIVVDTTATAGNKLNIKLYDVAFTCSVECCVTQKYIKAINSDCSCENDKWNEAKRAKALLDALIAARESGKKTAFDTTLELLQKICDDETDCDTNSSLNGGSSTSGCGCS